MSSASQANALAAALDLEGDAAKLRSIVRVAAQALSPLWLQLGQDGQPASATWQLPPSPLKALLQRQPLHLALSGQPLPWPHCCSRHTSSRRAQQTHQQQLVKQSASLNGFAGETCSVHAVSVSMLHGILIIALVQICLRAHHRSSVPFSDSKCSAGALQLCRGLAQVFRKQQQQASAILVLLQSLRRRCRLAAAKAAALGHIAGVILQGCLPQVHALHGCIDCRLPLRKIL